MQHGSRLLSLVVVLSVLPCLAHAGDKAAEPGAKIPAPIVAVIDVQRILQESMAAKSVQKQLETQRSKFQSQTEGEENELRTAEADLNKSRNQVAADVYADHEGALRQRFLTVERHVEARRKSLDQAFTDSMNAVREALMDITSAVANDHGVNLVIIKQQVLWADKVLDVTDEVLDRLNKKVPQVVVKMNLDDKP